MINSHLFVSYSTTDGNAPQTEGVLVNGAATYYSKMFSGANADGCGLHIEWTGTPNGTFTLWYSDKRSPDETNDNDWVQDTSFSPLNPAGSASKFRDDISMAKGLRGRLKYVNTSGTGTLKARATTTGKF